MSNSPLVNCVVRSPNHSGNRTKTIDTITVHCMAGNLSVESCGALFAKSSRQASSNYGIGSDGRIGLYVDEANRSWCTSSSANDQRAITIEVANTEAKHPWPVSDKAYAALVKLCVDICKRNNIKRLVWSTAKNTRINHLDGCNMTVHRDYAAKACPGDYLYDRHAQLAAAVNSQLGGKTTPATGSGASVVSGSPSTGSKSDEKIIWDFLMGKIGNACGVAGLMGNLFAESALRSDNLQNTYEKKLGYSDDEYTAAVDCGDYTNFVKDSAGYGLAQWTHWSRKQGLLNYAKAQKKSICDLSMQLGYLYKELSESYKTVLSTLKKATSVQEASDVVLTKFERPANQNDSVKNTRASHGQKYYDAYADSKPEEKPVTTELAFAIGDTVQFTGTKHYTSSNANNAKSCKPGKAKVTAVAKNGKHQYHLVRVSGAGSTVYGWVNAADVAAIDASVKKGSKVKVKRGAKTYTGGNLAAFVYLTVYDVIEVSGDRVVIGKGKAVTAAMKAEDLIVQ
ncbi:MAG: N-acetylmuramoyl-L-alanine amidase [Muribaculaceae bacterium]|nr:N-acetylmuramoyl-L-alanine amidase [Muribaculaceae bacterium]